MSIITDPIIEVRQNGPIIIKRVKLTINDFSQTDATTADDAKATVRMTAGTCSVRRRRPWTLPASD